MSLINYDIIKKTINDKLICSIELIEPIYNDEHGKFLIYLKNDRDIQDDDVCYNSYILTLNFNPIYYKKNRVLFLRNEDGNCFDYNIFINKKIKCINKIKNKGFWNGLYLITLSNNCKYYVIGCFIELKKNIINFKENIKNPLIKL